MSENVALRIPVTCAKRSQVWTTAHVIRNSARKFYISYSEFIHRTRKKNVSQRYLVNSVYQTVFKGAFLRHGLK